MNTAPQVPSGQGIPTLMRTSTVFMGRLGFLSTLLRLIGVELYKLRRRTMSKILSIISFVLILLVFGVISLDSLFVMNSPASSFLLPQCSQVSGPTVQPCLKQPLTQSQLAQAEKNKQGALNNVSAPLRLPDSLNIAVQTAEFVGLVLLVIIAGTIVGGEYSVGTVRLMFTRGPSRTQFYLSKIGAILVCIILGFLVVTFIGIAAGALLNLITGIAINLHFLTAGWIGHAVLYMLIAMLGLFVYTMLALFLSTLGKATVAGVAGALVWWVLESVLGSILNVLATINQGPAGNFLKAIPDYFISNNIGALLQNQGQYIFNEPPSTLSNLHALLVLVAYLILFITLGWWINQRRDVTN